MKQINNFIYILVYLWLATERFFNGNLIACPKCKTKIKPDLLIRTSSKKVDCILCHIEEATREETAND